MTKRWKSACAALLMGVGAGCVAAALIPAAESASVDGEFAAPSSELRRAPAGRRERGPKGPEGMRIKLVPGSVGVELRRADPAGGAPWVIRGFEARGDAGHGRSKALRCLQLGREVDGKFGWIDGDHVFRRVATLSRAGAPYGCRAEREAGGFGATLKLATLLDQPNAAQPAVRGSVLWGSSSGPGPVVLSVGGRERRLTPAGRFDAFLEFYGPSQSVAGARLRRATGTGRTLAPVTRDKVPNTPAIAERERTGLRLDDARVIARAPDPGGGPSWAVTGVPSRAGGWCTSLLGNLLGTHVGDIDRHLGLLFEAPPATGWDRCDPALDRSANEQLPVSLMSSSGRYLNVVDAERGVAEQRLLPGRTILWGRALPSVESVTIRTPRDVRTLEPTKPAGGLIAVYDGAFPRTASAELTVRMRDGSTKEQRVYLGGLW